MKKFWSRRSVDATGSLRRDLGRRAFLRGAFGTVVGVPLLGAMLNENGTAFADGSALPCRYFLYFVPTSLVVSGSRVDAMVPATAGAGYALTPVLAPLGERGLKDDVSAVSGLYCAPHEGPPGAYDSDYHGQAYKALVSGVSSGFGGVEWRPYGISVDERIARTSPAELRYRKLYFQVDPGGTSHRLSFEERDDGFVAIQPETSPANAYRSLFEGFSPPDGEADPRAELERRLRLSSLSFAGEQITRLNARLGAEDRRTLDEHLTRVRELERRLEGTSTTVPTTCAVPSVPDDPAELAASVPDQEARSALFVELARLAFACDMTRTITMAGAGELTGSGMRHRQWQSIGGLHGEVQHASPQEALDGANRFFVDVYAAALEAFKDTAEGEGSMLDSTAGLLLMEGGKGLGDRSRSGDGGGDSNHSCDNMIMLVGGRAGGLRPKGHIDLTGGDRHPVEVLNAAMRAVGTPGTLGEVNGVVDELF